MVIWIALGLAVVGVAMFVLPHHRGNSKESKRTSLLSTLLEFRDAAKHATPGAVLVAGLMLFGCVAPLVPAPMFLLAHAAGKDRPVILIMGGVFLLIGAAGTFFIQLLSEISYSLGSPKTASGRGVMAVLVWLFPALSAVAAFVAAGIWH